MEVKWAELSEIEEEFEEEEFRFEPVVGDCLEQYNEKRVYQAEMSLNSKLQLKETAQSQEKLIQLKSQTKTTTKSKNRSKMMTSQPK